MMKYFAITLLIFLALSVNGQKLKWLNKLSYNSTIEPGKAIMYGNFIQRLGFSSGGFAQELQIINLDTEELYSFTVKPALKSAKENICYDWNFSRLILFAVKRRKWDEDAK